MINDVAIGVVCFAWSGYGALDYWRCQLLFDGHAGKFRTSEI
jgi:hypothetical protein